MGTGEAVTAKDAEDNPFLAGVGLRIEPAPPGSGLAYARDGFVLGTMPPAFFAAVEETVHATLAQGLHGWQVTDCRVTLTHTGYFPRQSHAHAQFDKSMSSTGADFRQLTPLVVMAALSEAGTGLRASAPVPAGAALRDAGRDPGDARRGPGGPARERRRVHPSYSKGTSRRNRYMR